MNKASPPAASISVAADFIVQQVQRAQSGFWRPHAGDPDRQQRLIHRSTITV
jgi:hypothetical protein